MRGILFLDYTSLYLVSGPNRSVDNGFGCAISDILPCVGEKGGKEVGIDSSEKPHSRGVLDRVIR